MPPPPLRPSRRHKHNHHAQAEYDSRVKAMEVDEKPTEDYSDIGEEDIRER